MDIKSPIEFAKERSPKILMDVNLSLGDWSIINEWIKDYARYYHEEIVKDSCEVCQGTMYHGPENKLMCQTCHPYFIE